MPNLSQDIIQFVSILVDKLRTSWNVNDIVLTNPQVPIVKILEQENYPLEENEIIELGYYEFVSGTGYVWNIVLSGNITLIEDPNSNILPTKFSIPNPDQVNLSLVTHARNMKPYFYHGTYIDVNKELDTKEEIFSNAIYPCVILWEVIRQNFEADKTSLIGNTQRLTMS